MSETSVYSSVVDFPYKPVRRQVLELQYTHNKEVAEKLEKLIKLPIGWDGYRGQPVSFENAIFAINILERICFDDTPPPQIVPGVSGDIQLEWHKHSVKIELDIIGPNNVYFWTNDATICPDDQQIHLSTDFTQVLEPIKKLSEQTGDRAAIA